MATIYFDPDIKSIFSPYVGCMLQISIATDEGTFSLDLSNYQSVCRLSNRVHIAINGYDAEGNATVGHPMPPGGPLPADQLQKFNDWYDNGMPESADNPAPYSGVIV